MDLWVCGKLLDSPDAWEFQGVFSTEEKAIAARADRPDFFIGPAAMDEVAPDEPTPWPGGYIPAARRVVEFASGTMHEQPGPVAFFTK